VNDSGDGVEIGGGRAARYQAIARWVLNPSRRRPGRASRSGIYGGEAQLQVGRRGCASGAGALIEVEVRDGFRFGRIKGGRLVEIEAGIGVEGEVVLVLGRSARGGEGRRGGGQAEVCEDGVRGFCGGDEGEDAHVGAAVGAGEGEDLLDAGEEASPAGAGGGALRGVVSGSVGIVRLAACKAGRPARRNGVVAAEVDDPLTQAGVRCEDAVVTVAVDAGRRDQSAERGEKLEGREGEDGAAVAGGTRGQVEDLADAVVAV
jgi:hypothetical protein